MGRSTNISSKHVCFRIDKVFVWPEWGMVWQFLDFFPCRLDGKWRSQTTLVAATNLGGWGILPHTWSSNCLFSHCSGHTSARRPVSFAVSRAGRLLQKCLPLTSNGYSMVLKFSEVHFNFSVIWWKPDREESISVSNLELQLNSCSNYRKYWRKAQFLEACLCLSAEI